MQSAVRPPKRVESKPPAPNAPRTAADVYVGATSERGAERACPQRATFRLYHKMEAKGRLDALSPDLRLFVVYHTSNGRYW